MAIPDAQSTGGGSQAGDGYAMSATGRSHTAKPAPSLEQLMITKYSSNPSTMYPAHGFARGGIGTFVATGAARSGINQLPQSVRHARSQSAGPAGRAATANSATALLGTSRPASGATSRYTLSSGHEAGATGAGGTAAAAASHWSATFTATGGARNSISFSGSPDLDEEGGPEAAAQAAALQQVVAKEWEKGGVAHLADFQTATRRSRIHDVPGASKWAGLSFYETDPAEIKRHLEIVGALEQLHRDSKAGERVSERVKHADWAVRQRGTFRRQRLETALRYQSQGLPPRPSYAWVNAPVPGTAAAAAAGAAGVGDGTSLGSLSNWPSRPSTVPAGAGRPDSGSVADALPPPAFPTSAGAGMGHSTTMPRAATARTYTAASAYHSDSEGAGLGLGSTWGAGGSILAGTGAPHGIPLPKPTFVKVYDRMGHEINESPRLKEHVWRQGQAAAKAKVAAKESKELMRELDNFEDHLSHVQRMRARSQYAAPEDA